MEVLIKRHAFITMAISAIEVYKKECLGLLLGKKTKDKAVVEYAIVYQTAERKFAQVKTKKQKEKKLKINLSFLSNLDLIGDFHSHPQYGSIRAHTTLSDADKEDIVETDLVSLVLSINEHTKHANWHKKHKGICGNIGQFRLSIGAHYYDPKLKKVRRASLSCPYALTFDTF